MLISRCPFRLAFWVASTEVIQVFFESTNASFKKITQNSRKKTECKLVFYDAVCESRRKPGRLGKINKFYIRYRRCLFAPLPAVLLTFPVDAMRQRITVDVRDDDTMLNVCGLRKRSVDFSIATRWEMNSASFGRCQKITQNSLDLRLNHVGCVHFEINKFFLSNLYDQIFRTWNSCSAVF